MNPEYVKHRDKNLANTKRFQANHKSRGLCVSCNRPAIRGKTLCAVHLEQRKNYGSQHVKELVSKGLCVKCGNNPLSAHSKKLCDVCLEKARVRDKSRWPTRKADPSYRETMSKRQTERRLTLKQEVLSHYAGQPIPSCTCCAEECLDLLTIEHPNNDGNVHRAKIGIAGGYQFYKWLKDHGFPSGYTILCLGCNQGKHLNGGTRCPAHTQHAIVKRLRQLGLDNILSILKKAINA